MNGGDATIEPVSPDRRPIYAMLCGSAVSGIGNSIANVAIPWFVLETTGSGARTGVAAFAGMLPTVVGGLFGGAFVDRLGHRRASVVSDLASGFTVALIPIFYLTVGLSFWQLLLLIFLGALLDVPGATARVALTPELATAADMPLERANAAGQTIQGLSTLLGPPLGGVLIALVGPSKVLWVDSATFAVSALAIAAFVPARVRPPAAAPSGGYFAEMAEGLRFVARDPLLRGIAAPACMINFLIAPLFTVVLPVLAREAYGDSLDLGVMLGAVGAGSLLGAVVFGAVGPHVSKRWSFVLAFFASGLPFWGLALEPPLPVAAGLLALTGFALGPINPLAITVLQRKTPEGLRGRVFGSFLAMATAAAPIGMLVAGGAVDLTGVRWTVIAIAFGFLAIGTWMMSNPVFRELDSPVETESA